MSKDKEGSCNSSEKEPMQHKTACDSDKSEEKKKHMTEEEKHKAEKSPAQHVSGEKKDGGCCSH